MKTKLFMYVIATTVFAALMAPCDAQGQASGKYTVQELPDLGGLAGAASINDLGWAAGVAEPPGNPFDQAILCRSGQMTNLGTLGGHNSSVAFPNKNEIGWLVGGSETAKNDPMRRTFAGLAARRQPIAASPLTRSATASYGEAKPTK